MVEYFAHSGNYKCGIRPQLYKEHIGNVFKQVFDDQTESNSFLRKAALIAALMHDFGKLLESSQIILGSDDPDQSHHKMVNHTDMGVSWCLRKYNETKDSVFLYGGYLIHAHHIGLNDKSDLFTEKLDKSGFAAIYTLIPDDLDESLKFRDSNFNNIINARVDKFNDSNLDKYFTIQRTLLPVENDILDNMESGVQPVIYAIQLRIALSIFIDADHGDTARYYGDELIKPYNLNAEQRIVRLENHVHTLKEKRLQAGTPKSVIKSRDQLFNVCKSAIVTNHRFFICAAPTGKGKTLALMRLALRICAIKNHQRIFVIVPFTNIISQSVIEYRKAVTLLDERSEYAINEIHSKVEYSSSFLRKYSQKWNSPINVSTSVQFFESLFSNHPAAVKKIKQFANSSIVLDEYHTMLPHHLWGVALHTLSIISKYYNIDFIFGSGTHVHYWEIFPTSLNPSAVHQIVNDDVFNSFKRQERKRIKFKTLGICRDDTAFFKKFYKKACTNSQLIGNTIIVLNTVRNSCQMTRHFEIIHPDWKIFQLSSALTPNDRENILKSIHKALSGTEKILLIATSVVECGIDFSFDIGFREVGQFNSTLQFGGRVNRNGTTGGTIYEFSFDPNFFSIKTYSQNRSLNGAILARSSVNLDPDNSTAVIREEIKSSTFINLMRYERELQFSKMDSMFSVIDDNTIQVIIDRKLVDQMKNNEFISHIAIGRNSVGIYRKQALGDLRQFISIYTKDGEDVYYWVGSYDSRAYGFYAQLIGIQNQVSDTLPF